MTPANAKQSTPTARELINAKRNQANAATQAPTTAVAVKAPTAVAVPDSRPYVDRYLDAVAPASIVGGMIKFSKEGQFVNDGKPVSEDDTFSVLAAETMVGWIRFHNDGTAPDRALGLLFDGFVMPARETLGDLDESKWNAGLNGEPQDPWTHQQYLVLQNTATDELFTFITSSASGRRAIGNILKHYARMQRTHPHEVPLVKLRPGGCQHKTPGIGWVSTPSFVVVGRQREDDVASSGPAHADEFSDEIPF
jgi:hypothetical protein